MTSPSSLRDLYNDPSSAWSFLPAPISAPPNSTALPTPAPAPTFQWSNRAPRNSIFDLSPSLDLSEPSSINATLFFRSLIASAVLQYTSSAIAMPWEVGKLLLQVQWVPRDAGEPETIPEPEEDEEDVISDTSNDDDPYFADPINPTTSRHPQPLATTSHDTVTRRSVLAQGKRPEHIIPAGSPDGVWGMIKRVGRFRSEGWLALWKGLLTSCISEVLSSTMQPVVHNVLQSIFLSTISPFHQTPILLPVASHLITGFLLSPLDLIRTRLIVQSFLPRYRNYSGPLDALSQIIKHEGGLRAIYFHPHLLIPTVIDNTLRPFASLALPSVLASYLGHHITEDSNPLAWGLVELAASCLGQLVTLPFETVRRRLQVQVRGTARPLKGCVVLRPAPYNGMVDTFWHVLTEERSDLPVVRMTKRRRLSKAGVRGKEPVDGDDKRLDGDDEQGWFRHTGIGQLYRGLGMGVGASLAVFLLALLTGEERDSGWAEL